jgi:hypothetical protein
MCFIEHCKVLQKSPYVWQMVSLFTKLALYEYHYIHNTYKCVSPTHGELALTHLVLCADMQLECVPLGGPCIVS